VLGGDGPALRHLGAGYLLLSSAGAPHCWLLYADDGLLRGALAFGSEGAAVAAVPAGVYGASPAEVVQQMLWAINSRDFAALSEITRTDLIYNERPGDAPIEGVGSALAFTAASLDEFDDYFLQPLEVENHGDGYALAHYLTIARRGQSRVRESCWRLYRVLDGKLCEAIAHQDRDAVLAELERRRG
jgi:hypothetical protein